MNRYVVFLRGMNLGGRRITNDELRAHFEALGCEDVGTFRASGNVVFEKDGRAADLTAQLEDGLAEALGYEVPVFLRSAKELLAIAAFEAFDAKLVDASKGKLQVALLVKNHPEGRRGGRWRCRPTRIFSRSSAASSTGSPTGASPTRSWI